MHSYKIDKLSVLIVEDMKPLKALINKVITTLGVSQIFTAENGKDGFDLFCHHNPDIVITDWDMPQMSGIELLQKIRHSDQSPNKMVPIIMVTGYNSPEKIAKCRDYGITEFLAKPFRANDIATRISHVIRSPRDYIQNDSYFGPDRRRRTIPNFTGISKRETDNTAKKHV